MSWWFLEDRPIDRPEDDAFQAADLADQLRDCVESCSPPATVGLVGAFGTGKSVVANLLKRRLQGHTRYAVVVVSAEKHSGRERQRALVHAVGDALVAEGVVERERVVETLSQLDRSEALSTPTTRTELLKELWSSRLGRYTSIAAGAALLLTISAWCADQALQDGKLTATVAAMLAPAWVAIAVIAAVFRDTVQELLKPGKLTRTRARAEAADEIERVFQDLVALCDKTLVVVVEDIDRLQHDQVLDATRALRALQDVPRDRPPIFVVACDEAIMVEALEESISKDVDGTAGSHERAQAYMDKWFALRLHMPPVLQPDMRAWAQQLLRAHDSRGEHEGAKILRDGGQLERVLDVLLHPGVTKYRHLVLLLNEFFGLLRLAARREATGLVPPGYVTSRATLLARLAVLRRDFPVMYDLISRENGVLRALDRAHTGKQLDSTERALLSDLLVEKDGAWVTADPGKEEVIRYLHRTAAYAPAPTTLVEFIYFRQPASTRFIGSEHAAAIRQDLYDRATTSLTDRIRDVDDDHMENMVATVVEAIKDAPPGLQLANSLAAASGLIPLVGSRASRIANELAVRLSQSPETEVPPRELAEIVVASEVQHRDGLVRFLLQEPDAEPSDVLQDRVLAIMRACSVLPSHYSSARPILAACMRGLATEADPVLVEEWLESKEELEALAALEGGLPAEFFAAAYSVLNSSSSIEVVNSLLPTSRDAEMSQDVLQSVAARADVEDSDCCVSFIKALNQLQLVDAAKAVLALRALAGFTDGLNVPAAVLEAFEAGRLLLPACSDQDEEGTDEPPASHLAAIAVQLVKYADESHVPGSVAAVEHIFDSHPGVAEPVKVAVIARLEKGAEEHDGVVVQLWAALLGAASESEMVRGVLDEVLVWGLGARDDSSPAARFIEGAARAAISQADLGVDPTTWCAAWVKQLAGGQPTPGQWQHAARTIAFASHCGYLDAASAKTLEVRLRSWAGNADLAAEVLPTMIAVQWPVELFPQVMNDLDGNWDAMSAELRGSAIDMVAAWEDDAPVLPGAFAAKAVEHAGKAGSFESLWRVWGRIPQESQDALVLAAGRAQASVPAQVKAASEERLVAWLHSAREMGAGDFRRVCQFMGHCDAAGSAVLRIVPGMLNDSTEPWDESRAVAIVSSLVGSADDAQRLVRASSAHLGKGTASAMRALVLMELLDERFEIEWKGVAEALVEIVPTIGADALPAIAKFEKRIKSKSLRKALRARSGDKSIIKKVLG